MVEIKLKEEPTPTLWERLMHWLHGDETAIGRGSQVPKTGSNTEVLLSKTQKIQLQKALDDPADFKGDTAFMKPKRSDDDAKLIM